MSYTVCVPIPLVDNKIDLGMSCGTMSIKVYIGASQTEKHLARDDAEGGKHMLHLAITLKTIAQKYNMLKRYTVNDNNDTKQCIYTDTYIPL